MTTTDEKQLQVVVAGNEKQLQLVVAGNEKKQNKKSEVVAANEKKQIKKSEVDFPVVLKRGVQGRVKWYSPEDAYGFIHRYDVDEDIFVHGSSIVRFNIRNKNQHPVLSIQQEVEFDVIKVRKGLEARCVSGPGGRLVGRFFNIPRRSVSGAKSQKHAVNGGLRSIRQRSDGEASEKEKGRVDSNKKAAVEKNTDDTTADLANMRLSEDKNDSGTVADTEEAKPTE
ncbi:hypothetical protein niasHS_001614 [Heterodera schachtii]|uniref:CSD domain-containing protein n=1 Tax=Heterodera schachtii TaxID=97005 RepID=A0ABD2KF87_HETSC